MFLQGEQIFLRAVEPSDSDWFYKWENHQEIWPYSNTQTPFSRFVLDEFVNSRHQDIYTNKQLRLMIGLKDSNETVGAIDLYDFDPQHQRCGLGIFVMSDHRRKGIGAECLELVILYCFKTLHLRQIFVHVNASNTASLALFMKAGFEQTGTKKFWNRVGVNQYEDVCFLQCLNAESD